MSFLEIQTQTGWSRVLQSFADWCQPEANWISLDVGCGPGLLPALLSQHGCQSFSIDLEKHMFSSRRLHSQLARTDAIRLPIPNKTFHLVTASNLLILLTDPVCIARNGSTGSA